MEFVKESFINASPESVFGFHQLPDALEKLIPPWEKVKVIQKADISKIGSRTIIETKILGPIRSKWIAEHTAYDPPRMFEDIQIKGPFRKWRHRHVVIPREGGSILRDEVEYEPPLAIFGPLAAPIAITPRLEKMFAYRHEVTRRWCEEGV